jgi:hypothetical protein
MSEPSMKSLFQQYENLRMRSMARESSTAPEVLERLSTSDDGDIRMAVARNPSTPTHTLHSFVDDTEWVIVSLLTNINCDERLLYLLSYHSSPYVRRRVAEDKRTPGYILRNLASDNEPQVRAEVARNNNTTMWTIDNLTFDNIHEISRRAKETLTKHLRSEYENLDWL